ncbi:MAG TPA: FlgO family outer membrane protein [Pyrinomonadaceae bacterium]|nr:FlgO family outer membrane protein [Pyrinomonadaceae bacterium]
MVNLSNHYFEFGPFRLDLRERLLLKDGEPVSLTPKAFDVLAVLVQRSGSLVEKDRLLNEVWPDTMVEESSLSQKIYQLRKILDGASEEDNYIQTVPRHGYRFVAEVKEVKPAAIDVREIHPASPPEIGNREIDYPRDQAAAADEFSEERNSPALDHDIQSSQRNPRSHSVVSPARWQIFAGATLAVLLTAGGYLTWRSHKPAGNTSLHRIGVLPFKPLGSDRGNEMLGLGVADALIGKLSTLSRSNDIMVLPTNSVYEYSGREYDGLNAGRQLDVDAIVTGTIQRDGEHVRISAQMISTKDNQVVWSGQFDRTYADIFTLEDSISLQLAESLKPALTTDQKQALARRETKNIAAYEEYMSAIYFWNKRTKEGLTKGIEHFQRAIDLDQTYARAYAGLADCYLLSAYYQYGILEPSDAIKQQAQAARKAVELDDSLAEAHLEMAQMFLNQRQREDAGREFRRALEIDPSSSTAHMRYSNYLFWDLQLPEASGHMRLAVQLNPTSAITNGALAFMLLMQRNYPEAIKYSERALELDPQTPLIRTNLAAAYEQVGRYDQAMALYQQTLDSDRKLAIAGIARVQALAGHRDKAKQFLSQLPASSDDPIDNYNLALIHVALGENSEAVGSLEKIRLNNHIIALLKYDPALDPLRQDGRFNEFIQTHGLEQSFKQNPSPQST